jgi:flavin reductase ActVB
MTVNAVNFREALARLPTAVSVITTADSRGEAWGVTVGTLCSLSLAPPLVLFCLDQGNASHDVFTGTGRFLAHVLRDSQADVARWFARRGGHDFDNGAVIAHGLPSLPGTLTRLACRRSALIEGGDHTIVIGLVEVAEIWPGSPLLYHERGYRAVAELPAAGPGAALNLTPLPAAAGRREPSRRWRADRRVGHNRP